MEKLETQAVVIGAGVVGLAVARALAQSGRDVVVVERHGHPGEETSSRNSEVIHAGLYYPTGSLKARLCVAGREQLYDYCRTHQVDHRRCGKWIVAGHGQEESLESLRQKAAANGVTLEPVTSAELSAVPGLRASAALHSPRTGIVDSHGLMQALIGDIEAAGGWMVYHAPVLEAASAEGGHQVRIGGDSPCEVKADIVVNAAGLAAVDLAQAWQGMPNAAVPTIRYARGHYFAYNGRHPFERLIYPLPEPAGLGVHLTLDLAGQARFGPDVEWVDAPDYHLDPERRHEFAQSVQRWWPDLDPDKLVPAYAGVRPKLHRPDEPAADFQISDASSHGQPGLIHLFGIESPGLTACLALADEVVGRL